MHTYPSDQKRFQHQTPGKGLQRFLFTLMLLSLSAIIVLLLIIPQALAATGDPQRAYAQAQLDAQRLLASGINTDFAPLADVYQGAYETDLAAIVLLQSNACSFPVLRNP